MRAVALLMLVPGLASAASFNCGRAVSPVEKLICASAELGRLDETLAAAYRKAVKGAADAAPLESDQRDWLKNGRGRCADSACLEVAYRRRLSVLAGWNEVAEDRDIVGNYVFERPNFIFNPDTQKADPVKTGDCLSIRPGGKGEIEFALQLVRANAHQCSLEGRAVPVEGGYRFLPEPQAHDEAEQKCRLLLKIKRHTIELQDPEGHCRQVFCGARAGIDGTEFLRSRQSEKACSGGG